MNILLTSVGRRGYLVKYFKEALGAAGKVFGADNSPCSPAFAYCDGRPVARRTTAVGAGQTRPVGVVEGVGKRDR